MPRKKKSVLTPDIKIAKVKENHLTLRQLFFISFMSCQKGLM